MHSETDPRNEPFRQWIWVRPEPPGQWTARLAGLAEICATASTRDLAIREVRAVVEQCLASGQLVPLELPSANPWLSLPGHDPNDPEEQVFLEELARLKREDLEQTLKEYEQENQGCSGSSSTPTWQMDWSF